VIGDRVITTTAAVFVLSMAPFAVNLYSNIETLKVPFTAVYFSSSITVCQEASLASETIYIMTEVICRVSTILADIIVLYVTWQKTYRNTRDAREVGLEVHLSNVLLRDGTFYFLTLVALNAVQMGTYLGTRASFDASDLLTVASAIIISRFLLDLRSIDVPLADAVTRPSFVLSNFSDPQFAPNFVGSIGAQTYGTFGFDVGPLDNEVPDDEDGDITRSGGMSEMGEEVWVTDGAEEGEIMEVSSV